MYFFYQRSGHSKLDICSPPGNGASRSLIWASNLNIFDTKVMVQVTLELIYGIFLTSAVPTYLISQPTLVANPYIKKSLCTYERTRKITSVAISIPSKSLTFTLRCLESSLTYWVNIPIESSEAFLVYYKKISLCAKSSDRQHLFQQHDFPLIFINVWLILIQKNKDY